MSGLSLVFSSERMQMLNQIHYFLATICVLGFSQPLAAAPDLSKGELVLSLGAVGNLVDLSTGLDGIPQSGFAADNMRSMVFEPNLAMYLFDYHLTGAPTRRLALTEHGLWGIFPTYDSKGKRIRTLLSTEDIRHMYSE